MIVDFFRHGSGLSKGCLDYLLGEDREREHAEVLSGDVDLTAKLIDSSPFAKKYTSGCLSFYEHDLSDQDKQQIMQNFEECLFPGLDKDQYQILWVQHQDKVNQDTGETRLELNFVIPNVELSTGKRLQPFYAPVDLDRVDLFKQITNAEHQLYDPDDPNNQQLLINKKNLPKDVRDFKAQLHQRIYRAVANDEIADRQKLVEWLESNEIKVTRQTQKSISIENPYEGATRPIRLNGEIYEQGFRATGEYRQEIQQRIAEYRGTTSGRYRANVTEYQRQLEHKSQYHSDRYSAVRREISAEPTEQLTADREAARPVPSLATVQIEPFKANERADTDRRTASSEQKPTETAYHFEYGSDFGRCYFDYSHYCARIYGKKQVQRDSDAQYGDQRETNESGSVESFRGESEYQYMQSKQQQIPTVMHSDQREAGQIREWLLHSNGILSDEQIRNTVIENHRRTTAAISATTDAVAAATANFRQFFESNSENIRSAGGNNQSRSRQLSENAKVIGDNAEAISRFREKYSDLYGADQWQSQRDESNYNELRGRTGENLNRTAFSLITSSQSSAEFARNIRNIEANIVQMKEQQKEMEKSKPKKSRGMDFGM